MKLFATFGCGGTMRRSTASTGRRVGDDRRDTCIWRSRVSIWDTGQSASPCRTMSRTGDGDDRLRSGTGWKYGSTATSAAPPRSSRERRVQSSVGVSPPRGHRFSPGDWRAGRTVDGDPDPSTTSRTWRTATGAISSWLSARSRTSFCCLTLALACSATAPHHRLQRWAAPRANPALPWSDWTSALGGCRRQYPASSG